MSTVSTVTGRRPIRRLLIANRGEIAVRIMRTCREMGVESVAVYSDADHDSLHVRLADLAVRIGPPAATESYLLADRIIESAQKTEADAIHPGYGFLSEQAAFAEAVEAAGIIFVGPTPRTLASLGDKLAARASAVRAAVPLVPGTFEPLPLDDAASVGAIERTADEIGYPVLIKAAAGGGGRGMRRVDARDDLAASVTAASREARQAFGDGAVYLEKLIVGGRHIEVQLLGDEKGRIVALGERDCSTQRRHQKLVEEAPAPGLSTEQRRDVHSLAVRVAGEVGLRNAATAEFLFTPEGTFYFLEVNARLQVEHGVTELVTGLDLVREQLTIAAGEPLSEAVLAAAERATAPDRHAIELRISAEDPAREFAPVPGLVTRWREPGGPGIRNDSGIEQGWRVPGDYDPMLAKVLAVGPDRDAVLARARRAVAEFETGGVQTTLPVHTWLLAHPAFMSADLRTDFVDLHWQPHQLRAEAARRAAESVARAAWDDSAFGATGADPRRATDDPAADRPDATTDAAASWRDAGLRDATERWP